MVEEQGLLGAPVCLSPPGALPNTPHLGVVLCACALSRVACLLLLAWGRQHLWGGGEEGTFPERPWSPVCVPHICECRPKVMTV